MSNETSRPENPEDNPSISVTGLRPMLQYFNEELGQYVNREERFKLGQVLTIIDASIGDPDQRKAVKDLINNSWWGGNGRLSEGPMTNPHSDLRGMCKALGFELYDESRLAAPAGHDESLAWEQKRYLDAVKTKQQ
jgi:hypothetical protein